MDPSAAHWIARLREHPDDREAYAALKAHYLAISDFASAVHLIVGFGRHQGDPRQAADALYEAGQLLEHTLGQPEQAAACYKEAMQWDVGHVPSIYAARELYRRAGNLAAAASLYDREAKAEREPARRHALLHELAALRAHWLGDLAGGIVALKRALATQPEDGATKNALATLLLQHAQSLGDDPAALTDRQRAADLWCEVAAALPPSQSVEYFEAALQAFPDHKEAADGLSAAHQQLAEHAVIQLDARIDVATNLDDKAALMRQRLELLRRLGHAEPAFAAATAVLDIIPNDASALDAMEAIDREAGRLDRLLHTLRYRLELTETTQRASLLREIGSIAANNPADLDRAIDAYQQACEIDPEHEETWDGLTELCHNADRLKDLVRFMRRIADAAPSDRATKLYRRIADVLARYVGNEAGAAEAASLAEQGFANDEPTLSTDCVELFTDLPSDESEVGTIIGSDDIELIDDDSNE